MTDQVTVLSGSELVQEVLAQTRAATAHTLDAVTRLVQLVEAHNRTPEFHTVTINNNNDGHYVVTNRSDWETKSLGIINPTAVNIFLGIGGVSASTTSRALSVAPTSALVLPVAVRSLELGCDPLELGNNTAVVYLLRFETVQPLNVQLLGQ